MPPSNPPPPHPRSPAAPIPSTSSPHSIHKRRPGYGQGESTADRRERERAATILGSMEMLMWWSNSRNESLAQTTLHFESIVHNIPPEDQSPIAWHDEYELTDQQRILMRQDRAKQAAANSPASKSKSSSKSKSKTSVPETVKSPSTKKTSGDMPSRRDEMHRRRSGKEKEEDIRMAEDGEEEEEEEEEDEDEDEDEEDSGEGSEGLYSAPGGEKGAVQGQQKSKT
ncbi:hypothetical protein GQ43DRAFT_445345 [Delitschia confertaspora ATCC 74209]|uniref:Uncharacterized protein n=1 Tax=Delitschia confertaspora ATCC 74209 TaxID=1513339 RepID=A0A9P4JBE1_9PLEO|nr:hypothetical protein GQ43DRAFT_445345 [Delitschia confertaspora ATCC 74209]